MSDAKPGLILIAHGARHAPWAEPFERIAQQLRQCLPGHVIALAFLEKMAPGVLACAQDLVQTGCADVHLVPMFLGAGSHVREDLPQLLAQLQALHPSTTWHLDAPIGEWPAVIKALSTEVANRVLSSTKQPS